MTLAGETRELPSARGRLAAWFVVVGLALSAFGIAYIIYADRARSLPPLETPHKIEVAQHHRALVQMLVHSFLIFMAFMLGSYLMIRVGRGLVRFPARRRRTQYVDAWGAWRLSKEEIESATTFLEEDYPPDDPPPETRERDDM